MINSDRVLIFEDNLSGHRAKYAAVLAQALVDLKADVVLAIPEVVSDSYHELLDPVLKSVEIFPVESSEVQSRTGRQRLNLLRRVVDSVGPKHVYVPYADGLSQTWGSLVFPRKCFASGIIFEGLMMRGSYAYPAASKMMMIKNWISLQLIKRSKWDRIHQLDPIALEKIQGQNLIEKDRNVVIPEIIETPSERGYSAACEDLNLDTECRYVSCPGLQSRRKGIDLLLAAFEKMVQQESEESNCRLLLFGQHSNEIREALKGRYKTLIESRRIISRDGLLSENDFEALFCASEVVCVPYPRHIGSASILIRAARLGKKVLASDWGWVGWTTKKYAIGETCDVKDSEEFAKLLSRVTGADYPGPAQWREFADLRSDFLQFHTGKNYSDCFTDIYCKRHEIRVK